ncbi:MAG: hypothetical protein CVT82_03425 [Alphaproteobacteria bacterium HGW-Alphaproteobacteria-4]|nr:MAG: hypothetical protein CVT82_03425 [Alphaproteobacteria bacterium HGW-Alphaproteobacteria-4]
MRSTPCRLTAPIWPSPTSGSAATSAEPALNYLPARHLGRAGSCPPPSRNSAMTTTYGHLTWEQVRDADKDRVVILNVSATEDHGPHMTLDTDTVLGMAVAEGVAAAAPNEVFVMPPVPYGFNEHHKDFPGVIWIQPETLIAFVTDITKSLAHHGFRRILLLNGTDQRTAQIRNRRHRPRGRVRGGDVSAPAPRTG